MFQKYSQLFREIFLAKSFCSARAQISFRKCLRKSKTDVSHFSSRLQIAVGKNVDHFRLECDVDPWVAIPTNSKRNYRLYRTPDADKW